MIPKSPVVQDGHISSWKNIFDPAGDHFIRISSTYKDYLSTDFLHVFTSYQYNYCLIRAGCIKITLRVPSVLLMWPGARFSKGPETFQARRQILKSKKLLAAHKPVNFASLTDSFIISFSKLLEPWSWMQTWQTRNSYAGPKSYRDVWETRPVSLSIHCHTFCFTLKLCTRIAIAYFIWYQDQKKWTGKYLKGEKLETVVHVFVGLVYCEIIYISCVRRCVQECHTRSQSIRSTH